MKLLATTSLLLSALILASSALAGPPIAGEYRSNDIGGSVSTGRYSEGWATGGTALLPGVTLNAGSWNGTVFGTEWRYTCATTLGPAILLTNTVNGSGNGNRTYMKQFAGGTIWLSGSGPWGNGDPDYPGALDTYTEFETIQYSNFVPVAAVTNIQATAHFTNYPVACMTFSVSNGSLVGSTELGNVKPASYPDLLTTACAPTAPSGAWWNLMTMTLSVSSGCTTPTHASSWGAIKTIYR